MDWKMLIMGCVLGYFIGGFVAIGIIGLCRAASWGNREYRINTGEKEA